MAINADEGEPGTFKDRHYLERDPHRFLEGMLIAAWVVEADEIYIYLRDEYPHIREILARRSPGSRPRASPARPPIHLRRGAGAYICGEEIGDAREPGGQARATPGTSPRSRRRSGSSAGRP